MEEQRAKAKEKVKGPTRNTGVWGTHIHLTSLRPCHPPERRDKIANPEKYVENWNNLDARQQLGILNSWAKEIKLYEGQRDILKGLEAAQQPKL